MALFVPDPKHGNADVLQSAGAIGELIQAIPKAIGELVRVFIQGEDALACQYRKSELQSIQERLTDLIVKKNSFILRLDQFNQSPKQEYWSDVNRFSQPLVDAVKGMSDFSKSKSAQFSSNVTLHDAYVQLSGSLDEKTIYLANEFSKDNLPSSAEALGKVRALEAHLQEERAKLEQAAHSVAAEIERSCAP